MACAFCPLLNVTELLQVMLAQQESITQLLHLFEDARVQSDAALMQLLMMDPDRSLYQLQHAQEAGDRAVKVER